MFKSPHVDRSTGSCPEYLIWHLERVDGWYCLLLRMRKCWHRNTCAVNFRRQFEGWEVFISVGFIFWSLSPFFWSRVEEVSLIWMEVWSSFVSGECQSIQNTSTWWLGVCGQMMCTTKSPHTLSLSIDRQHWQPRLPCCTSSSTLSQTFCWTSRPRWER